VHAALGFDRQPVLQKLQLLGFLQGIQAFFVPQQTKRLRQHVVTLAGDACAFQADRIQPVMLGRTAADQRERNHVHVQAGGALHDRERSDPAKLVRDDRAAHKHIAADFDMAADRDIVREDGFVADRAVVRDMAVVHEKAAGADLRLPVFLGRAVRGEAFAEYVVVADGQPGDRFRLEADILRQAAQHRMRVQNIARPHADMAVHDRMRADLTAVAEHRAAFDHRERTDDDAVSKRDAGGDISGRVNLLCHVY